MLWHSSHWERGSIDYSGNESVWFPRLSHKMPWSIDFVHWNTHAWRLEPLWKKCNYPEPAMLGRPRVILQLTAPLSPAFQGTGHMSKAILDSLSQPISHLSTTEWSLWTPWRTEESPKPHPAWVADHSITRYNKMALTLSYYVLGLVVTQEEQLTGKHYDWASERRYLIKVGGIWEVREIASLAPLCNSGLAGQTSLCPVFQMRKSTQVESLQQTCGGTYNVHCFVTVGTTKVLCFTAGGETLGVWRVGWYESFKIDLSFQARKPVTC